MRQKTANFLMLTGALIVLGTAGDSDIGKLSIEGVILKLIAGIIIFGAGALLKNCPLPRFKRGENNG